MHTVSIFVLLLLVFVSVIQILSTLGGVAINVGRAWMVGTGCSLVVIYILSQRKYQPDGVMSFCRSMGVPDVEEMMFSYSWKVEEEAVRTLAKAVWEAGVGVWIDVVKLCPGDEIRPVVRTMVRSVYKCVVFISQRTCGCTLLSRTVLTCLPRASFLTLQFLVYFLQRTSRRRIAVSSSGRRVSTPKN